MPRSPGCVTAGCRQFFFKYCSTFDSTEAGNIGPVADALIAALGCGFALACPAFPGECAQRLSGPSVRRQHAAERERHGAPSADADDRRQPGARAVAADRRHGRPGAVRNGRAGCHGDPPGDDRAEGTGPPLRHRRCGERFASARDRRGGRTPRADHRRLRRCDGPAGEFPSRRPAAGTRAMPAHCRRCRGHAAVLAGSCSRATLATARLGARAWCRCCSSIPSPARRRADGRDGARLDHGQARRHADRHRRIGAAGQGGGAAAACSDATGPAR